MTENTTQPLTGKALLQKVKELSHLPRKERAKASGYYTIVKNKHRINLTDFYEALLAASGIPLSPEEPKDGRGREPSYRVSVHKNGQIVIGSTYTEAMGLKPGDEFVIKLSYKHIHLIQLDSDKSGSNEQEMFEQVPEPLLEELELVRFLKLKPQEKTHSKAVQAFLGSLEERKEVYQRLADS